MDRMDVYRELSKKLLMEHSKLMPKIWETVCSPDEAAVINALPATADDLRRFLGAAVADARGGPVLAPAACQGGLRNDDGSF